MNAEVPEVNVELKIAKQVLSIPDGATLCVFTRNGESLACLRLSVDSMSQFIEASDPLSWTIENVDEGGAGEVRYELTCRVPEYVDGLIPRIKIRENLLTGDIDAEMTSYMPFLDAPKDGEREEWDYRGANVNLVARSLLRRVRLAKQAGKLS